MYHLQTMVGRPAVFALVGCLETKPIGGHRPWTPRDREQVYMHVPLTSIQSSSRNLAPNLLEAVRRDTACTTCIEDCRARDLMTKQVLAAHNWLRRDAHSCNT
jgi:hypothetical protein